MVEESSPGRAADRKALLEALGAGELTKRRGSRATATKATATKATATRATKATKATATKATRAER